MKRFMFVLAVLLLVGLSTGLAQNQAATVVLAAVENGMLLEGSEIDWLIFAPGETYVITPGGFKEPPGPGETIGESIVVDPWFTLTADAGANVIFDFILPTGLIGETSGVVLGTSNWMYGLTIGGDPSGEAFVGYGPVIGSTASGVVGADGALFVHMGATVSVPNNAPVDAYFGQVICTAIATGN